MDARAVLARPRPDVVRARRRQRPQRADARARRPGAVPAVLERRDAASTERQAGDAPDARRHHQPVRVARRLSTARLSRSAPTPPALALALALAWRWPWPGPGLALALALSF